MKKILIVDDYEDIHDILTFVLGDDNVAVRCLSNATLLLTNLNTFKPDLMMLDVRLGDTDGRTLCSAIKANPLYKHVKIVLMSAMADGWKELPCKADAKIDKPFDIDEVRNIVLGLLDYEPNMHETI